MKLKQLLMSTAAATMIAGGALAQDAVEPETGIVDADTETAVLPVTFSSLEEMTVSDMIGMYVYDPVGNQISEIDYVIGGVGGPQVVLGIGGFLGLGEYTVALPLEQFDLGEDGASLRLNTDKETLKERPEFDESMAESLPGDTSIGALLAETGAGGAVTEAPEVEMPADDDMADEPTTEETTTQ